MHLLSGMRRGVLPAMTRGLARLLVLGVLCLMSFAARAAHWDISHAVCPRDFPETLKLIRRIDVPIGCELINCCPKCSPKERLGLLVKVEGDSVKAVRLEFVGLSERILATLRVAGAKRIGSTFEIKGGRTATIEGIPSQSNAKMRIDPVESEPPRVDAHARGFELSIVQMVGWKPVNGFRFFVTPLACDDQLLLSPDDNIAASDTSGPFASVLDYRAGSACKNDATAYATASPLALGANAQPKDDACPSLGTGACCPTVAVLSQERALHYQRVASEWTPNVGDTLAVAMAPPVKVPLSVWIVNHASSTNPIAHAQSNIDVANVIFDGPNLQVVKNTNHGGLRLDARISQITDTAEIWYGCDAEALGHTVSSGYYTPNSLNVYVWEDVAVVSEYCPSADIVFLHPADDVHYALEHEVGHSLELSHTSQCAGVPHPNVMDARINTHGPDFTVGQLIRMHISSTSMLNRLHLRTSTEVEQCPAPADPEHCNVADTRCPAISLDIPIP